MVKRIILEDMNLGDDTPLDEKELALPLFESFKIGRGEKMKLRLQGVGISREHCELRRYGDLYSIMDLGSTNGTYVNNFKIFHETPLREGYSLKIGDRRFMVHFRE